MNANLIILTLLACSGLNGSEARAIDDVDVDNSIEVGGGGKQSLPQSVFFLPRSRFGTQWLRFTTIPPAKIIQQPGAVVAIPCEAMGSQIPALHWVIGDVLPSEIENFESNAITETSGIATVKVRAVHVIDYMLSEPRIYTCIAHSGSKTIHARTIVYPPTNSEGIVQQREEPYAGPVKPSIVYSERMHLELMGSNVVLPCKVHARPQAIVTWKNEENIKIVQNQRFKILPTGDLLISDLKWEDMGSYTCIAENALGRDKAEVFVYPVKNEDK